MMKDLTNLFWVFAEDEAKQRHAMTMKDWTDGREFNNTKKFIDRWTRFNKKLTKIIREIG